MYLCHTVLSSGPPPGRGLCPGLQEYCHGLYSAHPCMLQSIIHDDCSLQKETVTSRTYEREATFHGISWERPASCMSGLLWHCFTPSVAHPLTRRADLGVTRWAQQPHRRGTSALAGDPVAYGQKTALRPLAVYRRKRLRSSTGLAPHFALRDGCLLGLHCSPGSPK